MSEAPKYSLIIRDPTYPLQFNALTTYTATDADAALLEIVEFVRGCGFAERPGLLTWMAKDMFPGLLRRGRLLTTLDAATLLEYLLWKETWVFLDPHGAVINLRQLAAATKPVPMIPAGPIWIGPVEWQYWQHLVDTDANYQNNNRAFPREDKAKFLLRLDERMCEAIGVKYVQL